MFHLQSLHKENIPSSQVFKCKWCVHIHGGYTQIQNYKFSSTLNEKCIIEEISLKGSGSLPSIYTVILQKNCINRTQKNFYPSGIKAKKKYNQGQLFHTNFLCYLLFLFLNITRISVVEHNQIYQPKSFHSGTFRHNLLYMTKYD